ncbi:MAG: LamG-like jellyroll fold domain-containing protein [Verrucomicrobiota bacterium]
MKVELLEAYLTGDLRGKSAEVIESALKYDDALREAYFHQLRMDAALQVLLAPERQQENAGFASSVIAQIECEKADTDQSLKRSVLMEILEEKEEVVPQRWPDWMKATAVAAVAALCLSFVLKTVIFSSDKGVPTTAQMGAAKTEEFIAKVSQISNSNVRSGSENPLREDGWLKEGVIEVGAGTAEVAFNSGARVLIEGPASFSIQSQNRGFLQMGRITAEVPKAATGFTVNTPRLNVVDISTRFGVVVDENGDSEVHVMQGAVEASRTSGYSQEILVREGLAMRADSRTRSDLAAVPYRGDEFELSDATGNGATPLLAYHFDESGGSVLEDHGTREQEGAPIDFSLMDGELGATPRRSQGYQGGGLVFDAGDALKTTLPKEGFQVDQPFTMSFWVKIPARFNARDDQMIQRYGRGEQAWSIGCNQNRSKGAKGALMVKFGDGYIIGNSELSDGQWHHVAVRFIGGDEAEISSHVHLFVDGQIESISGWNPVSVSPAAAAVLSLGGKEQGFAGWIDGISLHGEALSTTQIHRLFEKP